MTSPQPVPAGMHTVTPHLVCDNAAAAIDFCVRAFGATGRGISAAEPCNVRSTGAPAARRGGG